MKYSAPCISPYIPRQRSPGRACYHLPPAMSDSFTFATDGSCAHCAWSLLALFFLHSSEYLHPRAEQHKYHRGPVGSLRAWLAHGKVDHAYCKVTRVPSWSKGVCPLLGRSRQQLCRALQGISRCQPSVWELSVSDISVHELRSKAQNIMPGDHLHCT
jgi:hypothetical protein